LFKNKDLNINFHWKRTRGIVGKKAYYSSFLKVRSTFHQAPETLSPSGIEGETCSFHPGRFVSPVCVAGGAAVEAG
jgi:hypothetical protein